MVSMAEKPLNDESCQILSDTVILRCFFGNQTTLSTIVFFEFVPSLFENKAMVFTVRFGPMTNYTHVAHDAIGY